MAIDNARKQFAAVVFGRTTDPMHLPVSSGAIGVDDQYRLLWGYPFSVSIGFELDLNTRLRSYLEAHYGVAAGADVTTLTTAYLNDLATGDRTAKMRQLIADATEAME